MSKNLIEKYPIVTEIKNWAVFKLQGGLSAQLSLKSLEFKYYFSIPQPELIRYWQYECEEHFVQTKDGYTLGIHRIPRGRDEAPSDKLKPVVLMLHGIISSSSAFSFGPPDKSLAYLLADAGKKSIRVALDY